MTRKTITFKVTLKYENEDDGVICAQSTKENLFDSIENERVNGALTPDDISATDLSVEVVKAVDTSDHSFVSMDKAIKVFSAIMMGNDGVTIEDFIDDATPFTCSYMEDSIWAVDSKLLDSQDVKGLIEQNLADIKGKTLVAFFQKWTDYAISYEGDSLFLITNAALIDINDTSF